MTVRGVRASTEPGVQAGRIDTLCARHYVARAALLAIVAGCASRSAPVGIPPAPPPTPAATRPAESSWRIAAFSIPATYAIESRTIVSARADTLVRTDTLDAHTTAQVTPRGAAVDVNVTAYVVQPMTGAARTLAAAARAVGRFGADGGVTFEGAGRANCATMAQAAIESTRDLWVRWPAELRAGAQWRDSAAVTICRDNLPLQLSIVREYRLTTARGDTAASVLTVDRRSTLRVAGRGPIRGDSMIVAGEGTGTATLHVSVATGWVTDGQASSSLHLTARGSLRTQTVDQRVTQTFHQLPESGR